MKKLLLLSILTFSTFGVSAQDVPPIKNGDLYSLSTGNLYFEVNASFGAQVSSFKVGDQEILFFSGKPNDILIGSTFWPSPQSEWGWPPATELDSDPYDAGISGNEIIMKSLKDPDSKLVFRKIFTADSENSFFTLNYQIINDGSGPYSVAGWEVTRVPTAGGLTFFPYGGSAVTGNFAPYTELIEDHIWYEANPSDPGGKKFFADGANGWLAHVNSNRVLFLKRFIDIPMEAAAPGEAEIEFWHADKDTYVELENQSHYESVKVGDTLQYTVEWYAEVLPEGIDVSVGSTGLIEHVREILFPTTSVAYESPGPAISVYPNPVLDHLYIQSETEGAMHLEIFDITAKLVLKKSEPDNNAMVDVSGLKNGIYFYAIIQGDNRESGKLILW